MSITNFHDITATTPDYDQIAAQYGEIRTALDNANTSAERQTAIERWDALRREYETWSALVELRFSQDTSNEAYKRDREFRDELVPRLTDLEIALKGQLVAKPHRASVRELFGLQIIALWDADLLTFDPSIEQDLVRESKLDAEYTELDASAELTFRGETYNLSSITKFSQQADRDIRHDAEQVRWNWYTENGEQLDRIFEDLVQLRTAMAHKLGFDNFIGLGYQRMHRIDYNQHDVERFRQAVHDEVVPLAHDIRRRQSARLGVNQLMAWDEPVHDVQGNPKPFDDYDKMVNAARAMFDSLGDELSSFFRLMQEGDLLDLKIRPYKAGGGFCTSFATVGLPYIFANFNGTKGDVEVFTHEMGHAFQGYLSRHLPLTDYLWPTYESCEIHSMSLEFLTWPHMKEFFGGDAQRFRNIHLAESLLFLPYGVAVDHFQHLVYAEPDATPARRHQMWQEMEATYLPWRDWGDLDYPAKGGRWQAQRHIYGNPFYYIDYALAQTCALQFWVRAERDFDGTMDAYIALCRRGGSAPFQELASSAGLISPFKDGCLHDVVSRARSQLEI